MQLLVIILWSIALGIFIGGLAALIKAALTFDPGA